MGINVQWVIQTLVMLGVGIIGFLIKQSIADMKKNINQNNERIEEVYTNLTATINEKMDRVDELQKDFQSFKEKVVDEFVRKSEHQRITGEIMTKLDKIFDILMSIKTNK